MVFPQPDGPTTSSEYPVGKPPSSILSRPGIPIETRCSPSESIAYFTTRAAEKLRRDGSVAASISVYIHTNPFKEEAPQYNGSIIVPLNQPSDDTMELIGAALKGLKEIYRSGFHYKKSGVLLMGLQRKGSVQATLFDDTDKQAKSVNMMRTMDAINRKIGKGSVTLAASGLKHRWAMRRERQSQNYTTDWFELPVAE